MEARSRDNRPRPIRREEFLKALYPLYAGTRLYEAFEKFDRWEFTPRGWKRLAYKNMIVPLGKGSSLSEPLLVAQMINLADLGLLAFTPYKTALEIGTGAGFQTGLLSHCAREVFTVECNPRLMSKAKINLASFGVTNVRFHLGDGLEGWPDPNIKFDAIIVAAATKEVPPKLEYQLAEGGRLVIPVGDLHSQDLIVVTKRRGVIRLDRKGGVSFVPLVSNGQGGFTEDEAEKLIGKPKLTAQE